MSALQPSMKLAATMLALAAAAFPAAASADPTAPQTYQGVRVSGEVPDKAPESKPVASDAPQLALQYSYIGRDAAEPTIAIDNDGYAYMTAGAFDALGTNLAARQVLKRSDDGGITWKELKVPFYAADGEPTTLDPYVESDDLTGRIFALTLLGAGTYLAYSDDHGETWASSQMSSPGVNDHQTINTVPAPENVPYAQTSDAFPNIVYYCVNHVSDARCTRSLDGGVTWLPSGGPAFAPGPGEEACAGGLHGHVDGDKSGRALLPAGHCGLPMLSISEDAGLTWRRSIVSNDIEAQDVHTAVAADAAENLYYVWYDPKHRLPWLATSTDHGETWSEPLMVAPPGVKEVNFPEIVAGDAGRIALTFPGGTVGYNPDSPDTERPWYSYVVVSNNALDPNPTFFSNTANPRNDPVHRGNCDGRCAGMFDFMDIQISPFDGSVWAVATDTCTPENDCNVDSSASAGDAEGVAIKQVGGPWMIQSKAPPAPPTTVVQGAPPAKSGRPKAPNAKLARVNCRRIRRSGGKRTCRVRLKGAPGGTRVSLRIYKRKKLIATGATKLRRGKGHARLKAVGPLKRGKYRLLITTSRRGADPSRYERPIRFR